MFDYQAGERYKMTLIMVGVAGIMAGVFFTLLLSPTPEPTKHGRPRPKYADNPDITGRPRTPGSEQRSGVYDDGTPVPGSAPAGAGAEPGAGMTDGDKAKDFVHSFIGYAFDLNAASAQQSQSAAMGMMTPDVAQSYRESIWTDEMQKMIPEVGLQSKFTTSKVSLGQTEPDGSVVVFVEGEHTLIVPGGTTKVNRIDMEYLVQSTPQGMRIVGIKDRKNPSN